MKKDSRKLNIVGQKLWEFLLQSLELSSIDCFQLFISLLYLRRMDCQLKPYYKTIRNAFAHSLVDNDAITDMTDGLTYYNVSGFSLDDILDKENPDEINIIFDKWINGFDINSREVLSGLSFEQYCSIIKKRGYIYHIVNLLIDINLENELSIEDIREIYSLINTLSYGQYISPRSFSKCISPFLFQGVETKDEISIYDPVCGTSIMLQEVEAEAENLVAKDIECYGTELIYSVYSLSKALCVLTGKTYYNIECGDSLTNGSINHKFDYIIADLPMGLRISANEAQEIEVTNSYKDGVTSKSVPETYFIQMIMNSLKRNGRAAVITPGRLLFDKRSDSFRSWLLNRDYVETIIRLPKDNAYTSIERYAWILTKNKAEELEEEIRLVDLQSIKGPVEDILDNIDYLFEENAIKKELGEYFEVCSLYSISKYTVHLQNRKTGKMAIATIPLDEDVDLALSNQGFESTELGGDWEVLYDKTTKSYTIPFQDFFDEKKVSNIDLNDMHSEIVAGFSSIISDFASIIDVKIPNRRVLKDSFESTWAGEVPSEWKAVTIQELFECSSAYRGDKPNKDGNLPLLNVRYLRGEDDIVEYTVPSEKSVVVEDDDYIIIKSGANAGEVLKGKKGVLGNTLFRMRFSAQNSSNVNESFAKHVLWVMSGHFKTFNISMSIGSVKARDINSAVAFLPSVDEQKRIVEFLEPICKHVNRIEEALGVKIPKLEKFRDRLIFEATTGKLKI